MYSLQHVFWRGAMALSLLALGGVGAGVSNAQRPGAQACPALQPAGWQVSGTDAPARRELALLHARRASRLLREDA